MYGKNKEQLEKVYIYKLEEALNPDLDSEDSKIAFNQAMQVADRLIEVSKIEDSYDEKIRDDELKEKESRKNRIVKGVEIAALVIVAPIIDFKIKKNLSRDFMNFEKEGTFTTTPGRATSSWFRFKK